MKIYPPITHITQIEIVQRALDVVQPGERVLAIIPDKTRDDNTHILFPIATEFLTKRGVASFDALVAQGTHMPMTEEEKRVKIGAGEGSRRAPTEEERKAFDALVPVQAVKLLQDAGFQNVYNVKGGITAWSEDIDPSVPKY